MQCFTSSTALRCTSSTAIQTAVASGRTRPTLLTAALLRWHFPQARRQRSAMEHQRPVRAGYQGRGSWAQTGGTTRSRSRTHSTGRGSCFSPHPATRFLLATILHRGFIPTGRCTASAVDRSGVLIPSQGRGKTSPISCQKVTCGPCQRDGITSQFYHRGPRVCRWCWCRCW